MFYQTKVGYYYLKSLETITRPFVLLHNYSIEVQKNPEEYVRQKQIKKAEKLLSQCQKIDAKHKKANYFANKAAQFFLKSSTSEELKEKLKIEIERLQTPMTEKEIEILKKVEEQLNQLFQTLQMVS